MHKEIYNDQIIEQNASAINIAKDALSLCITSIELASIDRAPQYAENRSENDAEHSYMLGLVAQELAATYFEDLDVGLVSQFAYVHDLTEIIVDDTVTFTLTEAELIEKELLERSALDLLLVDLPPHTASLLKLYEEQILPEARFVRLVDKLMPALVDLVGPGKLVMKQYFSIETIDELELAHTVVLNRVKNKFPELSFQPLHDSLDIIQTWFEDEFVK